VTNRENTLMNSKGVIGPGDQCKPLISYEMEVSLRTRPPSPIATGTDPLVRVPARWYDADQQWICSSNIDVDDLSKAIAFYLQAAGLRLGRRFGSLGLEMLGTSSTIYPRAKPDGTTASWR
jgi:hypothetical protein